uniref:Uncharacterized protein n=1 Tax=Parascaris equorum TaxID=6256 RepID=A0A914RHZ6_PAREQ
MLSKALIAFNCSGYEYIFIDVNAAIRRKYEWFKSGHDCPQIIFEELPIRWQFVASKGEERYCKGGILESDELAGGLRLPRSSSTKQTFWVRFMFFMLLPQSVEKHS